MVKKLFIAFSILAFAVVFANAAPSHSVVDGYYAVHADTVIRSTAAWDTLTQTDSLTLLTGFRPVSGWEYILNIAPLTGTGIDTSKLYIRIDCKDNSGNVYARHVCADSISGATRTHGFIRLPMHSAVFGNQYDVKLFSTNTATTQIIVNRVRMWRRRAQITANDRNFR